MRLIKAIFLSSLITALPNIAVSAPISTTELNASTCFSCHGPEGKVTGSSIPPLAVYPVAYMKQSLKDIKDGKKNVTVMKRHVDAYSYEELDAIAEYIGSLPK